MFLRKNFVIRCVFQENVLFFPEYHRLMAAMRIDNVRPEILRCAFQRAGYSE